MKHLVVGCGERTVKERLASEANQGCHVIIDCHG
jgi:hypothetical protein